MTNEITNPEMCVYLRNGIEIWADKETAKVFGNDLMKGGKAIVKINGQFINTVEVVGIFDPEYLTDLKNRKQGMHKCKYGKWHAKDEDCECGRKTSEFAPPEVKPASDEARQAFMQKKKELFGGNND